MLSLRVSQLRSEVKWRTTQLQTEKETHETTQANIHHRGMCYSIVLELQTQSCLFVLHKSTSRSVYTEI